MVVDEWDAGTRVTALLLQMEGFDGAQVGNQPAVPCMWMGPLMRRNLRDVGSVVGAVTVSLRRNADKKGPEPSFAVGEAGKAHKRLLFRDPYKERRMYFETRSHLKY